MTNWPEEASDRRLAGFLIMVVVTLILVLTE